MNSVTTPRFRQLLTALPQNVQRHADGAYEKFRKNPAHPSLHFKQVKPTQPPLYSVRISREYRALGILEGDTITWLWIGAHAEYDRFLK